MVSAINAVRNNEITIYSVPLDGRIKGHVRHGSKFIVMQS